MTDLEESPSRHEVLDGMVVLAGEIQSLKVRLEFIERAYDTLQDQNIRLARRLVKLTGGAA